MILLVERLQLPTFGQICNDLGNPSAPRLARALGVHARTVERWRSGRTPAPRAVLLGLFWLTSWGQSELSCELHNRAATYTGHIEAARRENDALRRELARVLSAGEFGAANLPVYRPGVTAADVMAARVTSSS